MVFTVEDRERAARDSRRVTISATLVTFATVVGAVVAAGPVVRFERSAHGSPPWWIRTAMYGFGWALLTGLAGILLIGLQASRGNDQPLHRRQAMVVAWKALPFRAIRNGVQVCIAVGLARSGPWGWVALAPATIAWWCVRRWADSWVQERLGARVPLQDTRVDRLIDLVVDGWEGAGLRPEPMMSAAVGGSINGSVHPVGFSGRSKLVLTPAACALPDHELGSLIAGAIAKRRLDPSSRWWGRMASFALVLTLASGAAPFVASQVPLWVDAARDPTSDSLPAIPDPGRVAAGLPDWTYRGMPLALVDVFTVSIVLAVPVWWALTRRGRRLDVAADEAALARTRDPAAYSSMLRSLGLAAPGTMSTPVLGRSFTLGLAVEERMRRVDAWAEAHGYAVPGPAVPPPSWGPDPTQWGVPPTLPASWLRFGPPRHSRATGRYALRIGAIAVVSAIVAVAAATRLRADPITRPEDGVLVASDHFDRDDGTWRLREVSDVDDTITRSIEDGQLVIMEEEDHGGELALRLPWQPVPAAPEVSFVASVSSNAEAVASFARGVGDDRIFIYFMIDAGGAWHIEEWREGRWRRIDRGSARAEVIDGTVDVSAAVFGESQDLVTLTWFVGGRLASRTSWTTDVPAGRWEPAIRPIRYGKGPMWALFDEVELRDSAG